MHAASLVLFPLGPDHIIELPIGHNALIHRKLSMIYNALVTVLSSRKQNSYRSNHRFNYSQVTLGNAQKSQHRNLTL